jgi:DNA-binding CsgD family transcriptional regulator
MPCQDAEAVFAHITRDLAEILGLVAEGLTQQEIAQARGVSITTVRSQVRTLEHITGARDMRELRVWWKAHGVECLRWLARRGRIDTEGRRLVTKFAQVVPYVAFLTGFVSVVLVGCGDERRSSQSNASHHADGHGGSEAQARAMTETEEFRDAAARYKTCIETAGFYTDDDGALVLKDGSRHRRQTSPGEAFELKYALAEYLSEGGRCAEESGIAALQRAWGLDAPPDPESVREFNEQLIQTVACLRALGWTFRDFITIPGGHLVTEPILDPGEQDAYDLDEAECLQWVANQ